MQLMEEESKHRREMEKKQIVLEERCLELSEENKKVQLDLMRALIAKLQ